MIPKTAKLTDRMNDLFVALDAVPGAPETILADAASRERYESLVMFAFRKLQAARYHRDNIERLLATEQTEFAQAAEPHGATGTPLPASGLSRRSTSVRVQRSAQHYAFELSAFVAAIKSGLDFLAMVGALHLQGITADSIAILMKQANKGMGGPILAEVTTAMPWLMAIRDYRHHLIHRLVLLPTGGWAVRMRDGSVAAAEVPVVVPEQTPVYVPDTRRARMNEEEVPLGVVERQSFGSVSYPDGSIELLEHELAFEPAPGYVAIQSFTASHLTSFEAFFFAFIDSLIVLNFKLTSVFTAGPSPDGDKSKT